MVTKKRMASDLYLFVFVCCVFYIYLGATSSSDYTTDRSLVLTLLCFSDKMMGEYEYLLQWVLGRRCQVEVQ